MPSCQYQFGMLQVEFNKAALSLSDSIPADQKKAALNRLLKVRMQNRLMNICNWYTSTSQSAVIRSPISFHVTM